MKNQVFTQLCRRFSGNILKRKSKLLLQNKFNKAQLTQCGVRFYSTQQDQSTKLFSTYEKQSEDESASVYHLQDMMLGVWRGQVIKTAIDFDIFTQLKDTKMTAQEIADRCSFRIRKPEEFFNVLVSVRLLEKDKDGKYFLNNISKKYLSKDEDLYYGYFFSHATAPSSGNLANNLTQLAASMTIPKLDLWKKYKTVADMGGNVGHLVSAIIKNNPHMNGIVCDLPECREGFLENIQREKMIQKVLFTPLDFFRSDFPHVDVIVMGHVLHNYSLDAQQLLIKKAYQALPSGGSILTYEWYIDKEEHEHHEMDQSQLMCLQMICAETGEEITVQQGTDLIEKHGFTETKVHQLGQIVAIQALKP